MSNVKLHKYLNEINTELTNEGKPIHPKICLRTLTNWIKRQRWERPSQDVGYKVAASIQEGFSRNEICNKYHIGTRRYAFVKYEVVQNQILNLTASDFSDKYNYVVVKTLGDGACQLDCFCISNRYERTLQIDLLRNEICSVEKQDLLAKYSQEGTDWESFFSVWQSEEWWEVISENENCWGNALTLELIVRIIQKIIIVFQKDSASVVWYSSNGAIDFTLLRNGDSLERSKLTKDCVCLEFHNNHYNLLCPEEDIYRNDRRRRVSRVLPQTPIFNSII